METIQLQKANLDFDGSLMNAIENRRSSRKITHHEISTQELSNILWAACGETKKATKRSKNRRTIPSACNSQKVSILLALENGVYRYIESEHILVKINDIDVRKDCAKQSMLKNAPAFIIYVARKELQSGIIKHNQEMQALLVGTEIGAMSQNVYLYCALANLNTVMVALYDRKKLHNLVALDETEEIIFTQTIG